MRTHRSRWAASAGLAVLLAADPLLAQTSTSTPDEATSVPVGRASSAFEDHIPLLTRDAPQPSFWGEPGELTGASDAPGEGMPPSVPAGSGDHGMAMQHGGSHP